jgi:dephospho-CoA kinase
MLIIGVTGGIGSGKTTCAHFIEHHLNAVHINLDVIGHHLLEDPTIKATLIQTFGLKIIDTTTTQINRKSLGNIVFSNPEALERLNKIMHPKIKQKTLDLITHHKAANQNIVIDGALIEKIGIAPHCTHLIVIDAPFKKRNQNANQNFQKIATQQPSQKEYNSSATHIIQNPFTEEYEKNIKKTLEEIKNT